MKTRAQQLLEAMRFSMEQAHKTLDTVGVTTTRYLRNKVWNLLGRAEALYTDACMNKYADTNTLLETFVELHALKRKARATLN